jgi:protein-tyrosine phosphatase
MNTKITLPSFDSEILLCSASAKRLYDGEITVAEALEEGAPYRPLVFPYELPEDGVLVISENWNFTKTYDFALPASETSIEIDNLKTGWHYYYKVTVGGKNYFGEFRTARSTRFIKMPDVKNTRDIGGYTNIHGQTVKQGMVIRGTAIDGRIELDYFLKDEYIEPTRKMIGFKYDMDLRSHGKPEGSRFGAEVRQKTYNAPMYGDTFHPDFIPSLKEVFTDLAKPENYPVYVHCTYGTDRTGIVIMLLQGILGMSSYDMMREYHMTGFFSQKVATQPDMDSTFVGLIARVRMNAPDSMVDYLVNVCGVSMEDIESIRKILLED